MSDTDTGNFPGTSGAAADNFGGQSYLRKVQLLISGNPPNPGGTGLAVPSAPAANNPGSQPNAQPQGDQDGLLLSDFRITFETSAMDVDSPPHAIITVYNLADETANQIQKEFQRVSLQAGYENGNYGVIFSGTIIRVRKGKMSNIDTFVTIMASNLDVIYNYGVVNASVPANTNYKEQWNKITTSVNNSPVAQGEGGALAAGLKAGNIPDSFNTGGTLPRGKVMFGLARDHMNNIADSTGSVWSVGPDGNVNFHELTGYLPGEVVQINAATGMVGVPVATTQGIEVECLLNPLIKSGTRIQLNNADITTQNNVSGSVGFPSYSDIESGFVANTSTDGIYVALVIEHHGDNRDQGAAWITKIIALAIDSSAKSGVGSVPAYG